MSPIRLLPLALLLAAAPPPASSEDVPDPYLWLEDIEGPRALEQVKAWNAATEAVLLKAPGFAAHETRARAILDDERQIAMPDDLLGDRVGNIWRDRANPRGLWRVSPLADYTAGKPRWRTLIDVDALGKAEGRSWVWHGADCLAPDFTRCLVSLSPGGTDADVVREFDTATGRFVDGGFLVPEAKSDVTWLDRDTLLVATDWGAGSLTKSGAPRIVKLWRRGTPLASAVTLKEGTADDVSVGAFVAEDAATRWPFIVRARSFWTRDMWLRAADGRLLPLPVPDTADMRGVIDGRLIAQLNAPLGDLPAGALAAWSLRDLAAPPELVMAPTRTQAIEEVRATDHALWVKALDDVSGRLFVLTRGADGRWAGRMVRLADNSTIHLAAASGPRDLAFVTVEGMLTPPALHAVGPDGAARLVQTLPEQFDSGPFSVVQRFATSRDGTKVPYFLLQKRGVKGTVPVLIHAYGGFRNAQTPSYLTGQPYRAGPLGLFWAEGGNAYVLANIRGGGEYGPAWHQAALREKRQNSFDDLHAVAEDLVRTGITTKRRIAISGRSNGGVLVGAALTQRPDLYGAVIDGSPLQDMKRYSHLSAGASWIDEYGDPDVPADWAFMKLYSPYQNVRPDVRYPPVFLYLSTKDDRVHPGHARKMAAKLSAYGDPVYYHEYMEGGHSVGADHAEDAKRAALLEAFLTRELHAK